VGLDVMGFFDEGLNVGLADVGLNVGLADVGLDVMGFFDEGFNVGLADVGWNVGSANVGLDVMGFFDEGLNVGLADVGLKVVVTWRWRKMTFSSSSSLLVIQTSRMSLRPVSTTAEEDDDTEGSNDLNRLGWCSSSGIHGDLQVVRRVDNGGAADKDDG
jgi:hypothetical protein